MSEEATLLQVALLDRGESLVVMGRKKYDELYESMQELTKERDEARAEVERLRDAIRQVHALAEKGTRDWPGHTAFYALTEIHKITKGMVE